MWGMEIGVWVLLHLFSIFDYILCLKYLAEFLEVMLFLSGASLYFGQLVISLNNKSSS
jgi:hypothetical protein